MAFKFSENRFKNYPCYKYNVKSKKSKSNSVLTAAYTKKLMTALIINDIRAV